MTPAGPLVTVSGLPGAGTTTVAAQAAREARLEHVDAGTLFRAMAAEQGMDVVAFGRHAATHPEVDVQLDARMAARGRTGGAVLEGRLAGWVATREELPAVRVWVACDDATRAVRVARREGTDPAAAAVANTAREASERDRYLVLYGIDLRDTSIYDLVLDSTDADPPTLVAAVLAAVHARGPVAPPE